MLKIQQFQVGDIVFYILDNNPFFKIRKTRIAEITKKPSQVFFERYCFLCEDGHCFESVESLVPNFVYPTKNDSVSCIMTQLRISMEDEKLCIVSTFQRLERLQASLRVYTTAPSTTRKLCPTSPKPITSTMTTTATRWTSFRPTQARLTIMDRELQHWFQMYLLDILCGMVFWGLVFAIGVGIAMLLANN